MVELIFTSELALKRSIRKKYPELNKEQREATFEDQKKWIGVDVEEYLDKEYEEYKKTV